MTGEREWVCLRCWATAITAGPRAEYAPTCPADAPHHPLDIMRPAGVWTPERLAAALESGHAAG